MLGLASEPAILLAERLMKIVPASLAKVFYSDSGATATEMAFKLAAQYWFNIGRPEKSEFVGFAEGISRRHGRRDVGGADAGVSRPAFPDAVQGSFRPSPFVYRSATPDDPQVGDARVPWQALEAILSEHAQTNRGGLHRADRAGRGRDDRSPRRISARGPQADERA